MTEKYSYSTDDECYYGQFDSPEAAAEAAFDSLDDLDSCWVGRIVPITAGELVSADDLLEQLTQRAFDHADEFCEDWCNTVTADADSFKELVVAWLNERHPINFWTVTDSREITRESLGKDKRS